MTLLPADPDQAAVLAALERGVTAIAEAADLDAVLRFKVEAATIVTFVQQRNLGRDAERSAAALRLRVERRLGQLIEAERAAGRLAGRGGSGANQHRGNVDRGDISTLDDLGIGRDEAADFKRLAALGDDEFDEALTDLPTLSRRSVINLAAGHDRDRGEAPTRHPARYSYTVADVMVECLRGYRRVLDPFAGTGLIHAIADRAEVASVGVELEPEWAALHERTQVGNALALPFADGEFDAIATSPTYGNRLADHHTPTDLHSHRRSYTFDLGRPLHPDNSGTLQWGDEYRAFHEQAWKEAVRVLAPGGRFVLNISDHIRDGQRMPVTMFHLMALVDLGLRGYDIVRVPTPRLRDGSNAEAREDVEYVLVFDLP